MPLTRPEAQSSRWLAVVTVGPYGLLAALAAVTVPLRWSDRAGMTLDLALCLATAVWILLMFTLRPAWRVQPVPMAVFFLGLLVPLTALVVHSGWFGFLTPVGYLFAFGVLRWPYRLAGVGAVAVLAGTAQASGIGKDSVFGILLYLAVVLINVLPMCMFAWFDRHNDMLVDDQKRALDETSEANRRLEATLAENAGLQQQLMVQAREAGVLDERARMAREIHDTLAQGLIGIITQLEAAGRVDVPPAVRDRHITNATALARESLAEARRSVDALRPQPLDDAGLAEALERVAGRWSSRHGVAVRVTVTGTVRALCPEVETELLRTAQEALANVAKHADAGRAGITLSYLEDEVALDLRDDGRGFDPAAVAGGFGLQSMRQRIEGLHGTLAIESERGVGTAVSARVPFSETTEPRPAPRARADAGVAA